LSDEGSIMVIHTARAIWAAVAAMAWEALDHRATTFPPSVCSVCIPDTEDLVAIVDLRVDI
jgi:hypothetical protein